MALILKMLDSNDAIDRDCLAFLANLRGTFSLLKCLDKLLLSLLCVRGYILAPHLPQVCEIGMRK